MKHFNSQFQFVFYASELPKWAIEPTTEMEQKEMHTHIQTDIQTHMSNQNEMAILNAFWILFDWTSGVNTHMWTASDCINHFMLFIEMVGIINLIYKIEQLAEFMSLYTIFLSLSLCVCAQIHAKLISFNVLLNASDSVLRKCVSAMH